MWNQSFLLSFLNVANFIENNCFPVTFLQYDEAFLSSLLDSYYHYHVFTDPANGLKSKIRFGYVCLL